MKGMRKVLSKEGYNFSLSGCIWLRRTLSATKAVFFGDVNMTNIQNTIKRVALIITVAGLSGIMLLGYPKPVSGQRSASPSYSRGGGSYQPSYSRGGGSSQSSYPRGGGSYQSSYPRGGGS